MRAESRLRWSGIGWVVVGMAHQGYDLQLTRYDERRWRATFDTTGMEHSLTSATASSWEPTRWRAVQRAAWEAIGNLKTLDLEVLRRRTGENA